MNGEVSDESDSSMNYLTIGIVGIIVIVLVLQLSKRRNKIVKTINSFIKKDKNEKLNVSSNESSTKGSTEKEQIKISKVKDNFVPTKTKSRPVKSNINSSVWKPVPIEQGKKDK